MRVSCAAWEQVQLLGEFWDYVGDQVGKENLAGLGYGWSNNYFNYALGAIEDAETLKQLQKIDFAKTKFQVEYVEIDLPELAEWTTYTGREDQLREIYEQQIDCYDQRYDYELEFFDDAGNAKILIHY